VFENRLGVNASAEVDVRDYQIDTGAGFPVVRSVYAYAGAGTLGGLAPTLTAHQLYQTLLDKGAVWQLGADVQKTAQGNPVRWPKAVSYGTATVTAEGAALTESDATLGTILSTSVAYKHLTKVSNEVLQDSVVSLASFVADHTSKAMGRREVERNPARVGLRGLTGFSSVDAEALRNVA
jgi:HK97 family phage major capsid protein